MSAERSRVADPCRGESEWHVSQCACGQLTLRLGPIRIDFSRGEFAQLHRLVEGAMTAFDIAASVPPVHGGVARMH